MNDQSVKDEGAAFGVYFSQKDYASLLMRFLIIGIDTAVIFISIGIIIGIAVLFIGNPNRGFDIEHIIGVIIVPISYLYLAIYKRTGQSTIGYRVLGVKITNLEGKPPSIWQMTLRFLMLFFFGPLTFFVDILWLTGEENKQTLHDKMFGTYVIKRQAQPEGTGKILYYYQTFLLMSWMFREVDRSSTEL